MRIQYYIRPRNTTEESAFVEELIQTIAERQRHGRRGRVGGRFPVASRSRAGGPAAVPEGGTQVFALRAQVPFLPTNRIWSNQATMLSSLCKSADHKARIDASCSMADSRYRTSPSAARHRSPPPQPLTTHPSRPSSLSLFWMSTTDGSTWNDPST